MRSTINCIYKPQVGALRLLRVALAFCAASVFGTASADVYHWTGAALDGVWANSANWQEGEIPGMWTNRTDNTFGGKLGDTVIFGAQAEGAPTTIDLQGQYAIDHLIVTNGAPAYIFGTADVAAQRLGFQTNSTLVVAADVVNDQTFVRPAVWNIDSGNTGALLTFRNDSSHAKLVYGKLDKTTNKEQYPYASVSLYGVGTIEIRGAPTFDQVTFLDIYSSGPVFFGNDGYNGARYTTVSFKGLSGGTHEMEVPAGAFIGSKGGSWTWSDVLQFPGDTHIFGDGFVNITQPYNTPVEDTNASPRLRVWNGRRVVIDIGIGTKDGKSRDAIVYTEGASAELFLNGTNSLPSSIRLQGAGSVLARLIGSKNCAADETSVGRGDAIVYESTWSGQTEKIDNIIHVKSVTPTAAPQSKFYYSGIGETTDKDLVVSNIYTSAASVTLGNRGTGTLTWNGDAKQIDGSPGATFTFDPQTAPIVFGGLFESGRTWNLAVKGASTVSFSQAQPAFSGSATLSGGVLELTSPAQLPNVTGFTFAGGTLKLTESGAVTLNATFQSGASAIELVNGVELTLPALTLPSGASLNIVAPEGGSASVSVTGATPGLLPSTITYNGDRAIIDDQGRIHPNRSSWLSAQDGTWNTAEKWSNGVPTSDMTALVTASGESYTVAIDEAPAQAISDLKIANAGPGTATVAVTVELDMGKANIDLQPGGALAAGDGGTLYITNAAVAFNGGSINASGSGLVNVKPDFVFGPGTNTFSGTSCILVGGRTQAGKKLDMVPAPDAPCVLTLSDHATYWSHQGFWSVCNNVPGGEAIINIDGTDGEAIRSGSHNMYGMAVGCRQGYGELNLKHGSFEMGNFGLYVAADSPNAASSDATTPYCVTGVVNQTGGEFKASCWGWHYAGMICGLVVGDGTRVRLNNPDMLSKSVCVGFYNLSGGTVTISVGASVVGGGIGTGYFNHSGGKYYHNAKNTNGDFTGNFPLVIGLGRSGHGVWTMTGGTTDIRNHVYVGGAQKADLQHKTEPSASYYPDGDGCTGILDVSNGTFVTTQDLYVGAKGTGTLVLRPTGTIQAANVVLSNGVASVLRPVVEGAATGLLRATDNLVITDGARLEIDATGISADAPLYIQLASAENVVGEFSNVSIEYDETDPAMRSRFRMASILYERNGEKGLWLKAAPRGTMILVR